MKKILLFAALLIAPQTKNVTTVAYCAGGGYCEVNSDGSCLHPGNMCGQVTKGYICTTTGTANSPNSAGKRTPAGLGCACM